MAAARADPRSGIRRLISRLRIPALAALLLVVAGCGSGGDDTAPRAPRSARSLTAAQRDSLALVEEERAGAHRDSLTAAAIRPVLEDWEEAWKRVIPGFQLDSLRWQKRDTLTTTTGPLAASALDSLTQRRWKLEFTSDRWLAVDPDFARVFAPSGRLQGRAEPRVTVYDFRAHQSQVLEQAPGGGRLGTSGTEGRPFAVAGWIGERRLVVAGWRPWSSASGTRALSVKLRPAVWIYDLDSRHRTTGMGPPVNEPELQAHEAMLELLIRQRNAPTRRR